MYLIGLSYSRVRVRKRLSDVFPIRNDFKQGDALPPLPLNFGLEYSIRMVQVYQDSFKIKWYTSGFGLC